MGVVASNDDAAPPVRFGDYAYDAYWSAEKPPPGTPADETVDYAIRGRVIRLVWDYGVRIPLWDGGGLLPEEPEWLREALGLSERLINDLRQWGLDMNELDATPGRRTKEAYEGLDLRGRELARRVQQEVGSRYSVRYHPW